MITLALALSLAMSPLPDLELQAPKSVDVCATVWASEVPVKVVRPDKLEGTATWTVVKSPEGVKATIVTGDDDTARVCLRGFCDTAPGTFELVVKAKIGDQTGQATVSLVRGQAKILLVDDDRSSNNAKSPGTSLSGSDTLYRQLLQDGDGLHSLVYDSMAVEQYSNGPDEAKLEGYDAVFWYTGGEYGGNPGNAAVVSDVDVVNLIGFLKKGKSIVMVSPGSIANWQGYVKSSPSNEDKWIITENPFLKGPAGLKGGRELLHRFDEVDIEAEGGVKFHLNKAKPIETQISPVNPDKAKPLFFATLNPDGKGPRLVPCATANVTETGTTVFAGFSFENLADRASDAFRILVSPAWGWDGVVPKG